MRLHFDLFWSLAYKGLLISTRYHSLYIGWAHPVWRGQ